MLRQPQRVVGVHAGQRRLSVIQVVGTLAKVEIQDVDAEHLFHVAIAHAALHVFRDGLGHTVQHALQVVQLTTLLNLHQDNLTLRVLGLDVHAVVFVVLALLVRLTLQQFQNGHFLAHQHRDKTLEDGKVGLVAQHVLRCPVKADKSLLTHSSFFLLPQSYKTFLKLPKENREN